MTPDEAAQAMKTISERMNEDIQEVSNDKELNACFIKLLKFCISKKTQKLSIAIAGGGFITPLEFRVFTPYPIPPAPEDAKQ